MARQKKSTGKGGGGKAAAGPADVESKVVEAALALAAERPWSEIPLIEIARASGLPLSEVYRYFPGKQAILSAFSRRIDAEVLSEAAAEEEVEGTARERLFEVLMRRFDALQPYRRAVANILYDGLRRPLEAAGGLPQLCRSMSWMLEAAGLSSEGAAGLLRLQGLIGIYLSTLRVWLKDDSPDLARTMAALDGQLRRVEWFAARFRGGAAAA